MKASKKPMSLLTYYSFSSWISTKYHRFNDLFNDPYHHQAIDIIANSKYQSIGLINDKECYICY